MLRFQRQLAQVTLLAPDFRDFLAERRRKLKWRNTTTAGERCSEDLPACIRGV
jgi:hypothetical protein